MSHTAFIATHAGETHFERGPRTFFEYRDLGLAKAAEGRVVAHVIRAAEGADFSGQPHLHETQFQFVYVLKGWVGFEREGQGVVRLEAGSSVYQAPCIRHRELGHSADLQLQENVTPPGFATREVHAVQP